MRILHHKCLSIPIEFCISIVTTDMHMDGFMLT